MFNFPLSLLLFCLFLFSCISVQNNLDINEKIDIPSEWHSSIDLDNTINNEWWKEFEDNDLDSLITLFLNNNYNLKLAYQALQSSLYKSKINGTEIFPSISYDINKNESIQNFSGSAFEDVANLFSESDNDVITSSTKTYGMNLGTRWEIDIWGRLLSKRYSEKKDYLAVEYDYKYMELSLLSNFVKTYFLLLESSEQVLLAENSVNAYKDIFNIVEKRYNQGIRSSLDYRLSASNLSSAEAVREQRKIVYDQIKTKIKIFLGEYPDSDFLSFKNLPQDYPSLPDNMPSDLLNRRPDIIASEMRMHASKLRLVQAKRMRLPSFNLVYSTGYSSANSSDIAKEQNYIWNLAMGLTLPLFQAGRLKANQKLSESELNRSELEYIQTVLNAFSEVESKISSHHLLLSQLDALNKALEQAEEALNLSKDRYDAGISELITVLDSQRRVFDTRSQMILIKRQLIDNRIDLILALGGTYETE